MFGVGECGVDIPGNDAIASIFVSDQFRYGLRGASIVK